MPKADCLARRTGRQKGGVCDSPPSAKSSFDRHSMTRPSVFFRSLIGVGAIAFAAVALPQSPTKEAETPKGDKADQGVSADLFYRLLLGDVALQRGDTALAARAYLDAARESQDARI